MVVGVHLTGLQRDGSRHIVVQQIGGTHALEC